MSFNLDRYRKGTSSDQAAEGLGATRRETSQRIREEKNKTIDELQKEAEAAGHVLPPGSETNEPKPFTIKEGNKALDKLLANIQATDPGSESHKVLVNMVLLISNNELYPVSVQERAKAAYQSLKK